MTPPSVFMMMSSISNTPSLVMYCTVSMTSVNPREYSRAYTNVVFLFLAHLSSIPNGINAIILP